MNFLRRRHFLERCLDKKLRFSSALSFLKFFFAGARGAFRKKLGPAGQNWCSQRELLGCQLVKAYSKPYIRYCHLKKNQSEKQSVGTGKLQIFFQLISFQVLHFGVQQPVCQCGAMCCLLTGREGMAALSDQSRSLIVNFSINTHCICAYYMYGCPQAACSWCPGTHWFHS